MKKKSWTCLLLLGLAGPSGGGSGGVTPDGGGNGTIKIGQT